MFDMFGIYAAAGVDELLASGRTKEILAALKGQADIVLVDSPPVLPVSDATVISSSVDGTVVVATCNVTQRRQLGRALELLRQVEAQVIGTVLNRAKVGGVYGYDGYYGYRREGAAEKYVASSPRDTPKRRRRRSRRYEEPDEGYQDAGAGQRHDGECERQAARRYTGGTWPKGRPRYRATCFQRVRNHGLCRATTNDE